MVTCLSLLLTSPDRAPLIMKSMGEYLERVLEIISADVDAEFDVTFRRLVCLQMAQRGSKALGKGVELRKRALTESSKGEEGLSSKKRALELYAAALDWMLAYMKTCKGAPGEVVTKTIASMLDAAEEIKASM